MQSKEIMIWLILKQIIVIACFTILSISFNHWWIILFAYLFMNTTVTVNQKKE